MIFPIHHNQLAEEPNGRLRKRSKIMIAAGHIKDTSRITQRHPRVWAPVFTRGHPKVFFEGALGISVRRVSFGYSNCPAVVWYGIWFQNNGSWGILVPIRSRSKPILSINGMPQPGYGRTDTPRLSGGLRLSAGPHAMLPSASPSIFSMSVPERVRYQSSTYTISRQH